MAVNNDGCDCEIAIPCADGAYRGTLHGGLAQAENGRLSLRLRACDGEILIPESRESARFESIRNMVPELIPEPGKAPMVSPGRETREAEAGTTSAGIKPELFLDASKPYEQMSVEELQAAILQKLANNGPVTDQMRRDVAANIWRDSLLNWVKSFR